MQGTAHDVHRLATEGRKLRVEVAKRDEGREGWEDGDASLEAEAPQLIRDGVDLGTWGLEQQPAILRGRLMTWLRQIARCLGGPSSWPSPTG